MHDTMEDLKGGGDTFDFRKTICFQVSSISGLKSALGVVFLEAGKKEGTCNNYKAGVGGVRLGKGVWLRLWARKVLFEVVCISGLEVKGTLRGLFNLVGGGDDSAVKRLEFCRGLG